MKLWWFGKTHPVDRIREREARRPPVQTFDDLVTYSHDLMRTHGYGSGEWQMLELHEGLAILVDKVAEIDARTRPSPENHEPDNHAG